jgi:uncharacterized protein
MILDYDTIIEKYYPKDSESYRIYYTHCKAVTDLALEIAARNPSLNADIETLETAAMLHDIGVFMTDAPGICCYGVFPYISHGYLGRQLLEKEGLVDIAPTCERHIGTGITLEEIISLDLPLPHREMIPQTIEEKIICYADKFYSKSAEDLTKPKSLNKIDQALPPWR